MRRLLRSSLLASLLLTPLSIHAEGWSGQGEAGLVKSSGNTESENFNVGLGLSNDGEVWHHEFGIGLYKASADGADSADSINADYTVKRDFSERRFAFGTLSYLDDKFDGFTEQSSVALGYGYRIVMDEPNLWEVGVGVGYRDTHQAIKLANGNETEGKDVSGATLVLSSKFARELTPNTTLLDNFKSEIGSDNTFIENDLSLLVAMNEAFSLKAGFLVRHNSDPAPGTDDTDTITSLNLVYNFK